ncbi:MAG TPA: hypothetical protein VE664_02795 [Actinomycetes bacterium]|nr:hypothetical protein [Actinomycetes bacterium]
MSARTYELRLRIASDASDWDSSRCWLAWGGFLAVLIGGVNPFAGLALGAGSLALVGGVVGSQAGEAVTGTSPGESWTQIASTDDSATYTNSASLPNPGPTASITAATTGPEGLTETYQVEESPHEHGRAGEHRAHGSQVPPLSLTLGDGKVAAVHGERLVIAIPFDPAAGRGTAASAVTAGDGVEA